MFAAALLEDFSSSSEQALAVAVPLSAGPILVCLVLGPQMGMLLALTSGLLAPWPGRRRRGMIVYYFVVSGVAAAHYAGQEHTIFGLIKADLRGSLLVLLMVMGLAMWQS
ncbi:membrane hypothetical protein [Desulfarculales bacterium]